MFIRFALPFICCLLISSCQSKMIADSKSSQILEVSVLYRERIALPPGAELLVTLNDVSKMDVPATIISSSTQKLSSGPPYSVSLSYSEDQIEPNHRYSLRAKIRFEGKLLFISTYTIDPFGSEVKQPIQIIVEKVSQKPAEKPLATLVNTHWRLLKIGETPIRTEPDQQKEAYLYLAPNDQKIRGFSGCHPFTGSYDQQDKELTFRKIAITSGLCSQQGLETEQLFMNALTETVSYRLSGEELYLFGMRNNVLAAFKATYF